MQASVRSGAGNFAAPVTLSPAGVSAFSATTAIDAAGDAIAAWQTSAGAVQLAVYDDSPLPTPPPPPPPPPTPPCTDCDGDGSPTTLDCNDANAAIHPGAVDRPANAVDENCDGRDATYPRLRSQIFYTFARTRHGTRLTTVTVRPVVAGTTIVLRCTGRGCPSKINRLTVRKDARSRDIAGLLKHRRLRPGTRVDIRLTKPENIGVVSALRIGSNRVVRTDRCLTPGSSSPIACPQ